MKRNSISQATNSLMMIKSWQTSMADTNANPYADDASNNEAENLNTKTVKRGDKLVYQVWLDTTKFDAD